MAVDTVLHALAEPTRLEVLEALARRPSTSASALARELPVSRQMVLKHLTLLQGCGLVSSHRQGREVLFAVNPAPLEMTAHWLLDRASAWDARLADLKARAEAPE